MSGRTEVFESRTFEFSVKACWGQTARQDKDAGPEMRAEVAGRGSPALTFDSEMEQNL